MEIGEASCTLLKPLHRIAEIYRARKCLIKINKICSVNVQIRVRLIEETRNKNALCNIILLQKHVLKLSVGKPSVFNNLFRLQQKRM